MAAKLTRLAHKIAIQLRLLAESCTVWSSRSRRPVRKRLDTHSYTIRKCATFELNASRDAPQLPYWPCLTPKRARNLWGTSEQSESHPLTIYQKQLHVGLLYFVPIPLHARRFAPSVRTISSPTHALQYPPLSHFYSNSTPG